jgi:prepilin-type N-terminal cleavage/methylation domain-containing protein
MLRWSVNIIHSIIQVPAAHETNTRSSAVHRRAAFTIVEIMIAVVIIGLLAMLAIPAITRTQRVAKNNRFISDLRVFVQSFETFALENGTWPPNSGSGVVPAGMNGAVSTKWTAQNSLGGRWNWDRDLNVDAGISTTNVSASDVQMTAIDAKIDDGNLATGNFRKFDTRFTFILEN